MEMLSPHALHRSGRVTALRGGPSGLGARSGGLEVGFSWGRVLGVPVPSSEVAGQDARTLERVRTAGLPGSTGRLCRGHGVWAGAGGERGPGNRQPAMDSGWWDGGQG